MNKGKIVLRVIFIVLASPLLLVGGTAAFIVSGIVGGWRLVVDCIERL